MDDINFNKDYYSVLGIGKSASKDEIHKAFLKKSKENHPDLHPDDKDATRKFQEIQEANDILSNDEKRKTYDSVRAGGGRSRMYSGFSDMDPFSDEIFSRFRRSHNMGGMGGFGGYKQPRRPRTPERGRNIRIAVELPFEDFFFGCIKTFDIKVNSKCQYCKNGLDGETAEYEKCPYCEGSGMRVSRNGNMMMQETCQNCAGTGEVIKNRCKHCHGTSIEGERIQTLNFEIPKCSDDVFEKTYSHQGHCGLFGGETGDITIVARMSTDGKFFRRGYDTLGTVHFISVFKALAGGTEFILTPYGKREIEIPKGLEDGEELTFKGLGIKKRNENGNGDLSVIFKYDMPKDISGQELNALRKVSEKFEKKPKLFKNISVENEYTEDYLNRLKSTFGGVGS